MTSTTLKLTALALMLLDHIHQFIPGMPLWLTWLGRISAPLFFFCTAWGFFYTHNRKKYLLNLYCWGVGMALGDVLISMLRPTGYGTLYNNIFVTLLLMCSIIHLVELYQQKQKKQAIFLIFLLLVCQIVSVCFTFPLYLLTGNSLIALIPSAVFPSLLTCEGGLVLVGMGVCLYFTRNHKKWLSIGFVLFCLIFFFSSGQSLSLNSLFFHNYQWMMVGSLPLMLLYNGQKGRGLKWLFYVFYPAHIFILYLIGSVWSF